MKTLFIGDICPTKYSETLFANGDTDALFGDTRRLFEGNDMTFVNLECAITDSENRIKKFGPHLKAPKNTAKVLKDLNVTVAGLSNNHVFDFGKEGALDTIEALTQQGIDYTGFGNNYDDSKRNYVYEKNGEKICVIAVCEHEYSYALENRMGSRPFDEFETLEDIREAKKHADRVIVAYHGGKEMCLYPSPRLVRACRAMARAGADLILCQHTHCIGAYEFYDDCHILYGQGNFHFCNLFPHELWPFGFAVSYDTKEHSVEFTPVRESETDGAIRLCVGEDLEKIMKDFAKRNESMQNGQWKQGWHQFCLESAEGYCGKLALVCSEGATELDNAMLGHYLDCEAHNDVVRELFTTWNHTNELD